MDRGERAALVAQYADGYRVITEALAGITDAELDTPEAPGEWSPRQVVHHLADSEMTSAIRVRRLIAEEEPQIVGYDQEAFARRLYYPALPIEASLLAFRGARESTAALLRCLTPAEWERAGTHTESGRYSVDDWLALYAAHAHDHAEQIRRARAVAQQG